MLLFDFFGPPKNEGDGKLGIKLEAFGNEGKDGRPFGNNFFKFSALPDKDRLRAEKERASFNALRVSSDRSATVAFDADDVGVSASLLLGPGWRCSFGCDTKVCVPISWASCNFGVSDPSSLSSTIK